MAMTKQERATRRYIMNYLRQQGYPTYARLLYKCDLNFHNPQNSVFVAAMSPKTGTIYINPTITDPKAISVFIRHEILHNYLKHHNRLMKHLANKAGLDYDKIDDLSLDQLEKQLYATKDFNIAGDYEISNRGYTSADKAIIRRLGEFGNVFEVAKKIGVAKEVSDLRGLITEDEHPDWVYDSVEEMYDKLVDQGKKLKQQAANNSNKNNDKIVNGLPIFKNNGEIAGFMDPDSNCVWADKESQEWITQDAQKRYGSRG